MTNETTLAGIPVSELRYWIDRMQIRDCMARYIRGVDRHDVELMETAFWPDAQLNYTNGFSGGRDEFIAWANNLHETLYARHQHHIANQHVDLDAGGDVAHVESYVIYLLRTPEGRQDFGAGRYIDIIERRDSEWRIALREFIPEMRFSEESLYNDTTIPPFARGSWDRSDLSYTRPLQRRNANEAVNRLPDAFPITPSA
jgi:hypothetical protein